MQSLHLSEPHTGASGYCQNCNCTHTLAAGKSRTYALKLIERLELLENIDFSAKGTTGKESSTSTLPLWQEPRGKMFGILDCVTKEKKRLQLYSFSGQFNGQWFVDGWVPPLFDIEEFDRLNYQREKEIKQLTRQIEKTPPHSSEWLALRKVRKNKSRGLMKDIHSLYRLTNFRGETKKLSEVFNKPGNIPTGTGDCCAPKLLNFAARNDLTPLGICEFFYGRQTKSGSHSHGQFSSPCIEKCSPILGFMLCGLEGKNNGT